ncbi:halocyanin domain-containing protein [Natronomonas sp. F2-12]|jgi:serine/threonine-protein kinase|uniref:Halocyanin domain-containing protein n=1 Tax=Natronomonas aquatica TaxID=2841590 RepID=A0A9R1D4C4_9EURY|nr:halocyanin domain-containing protein [Natronomonas aquatica]MCQ4333209.1 halocyanin domain-containing protein [Natronomonas aquatica]
MREISRRRFVLATGAVAATGALAGCSGNGNGGNGNGNGGNGNGNGGGGPTGTAETYLSDNEANTYESVQDMTGESEVTVSVGAGDSGFAFEPAGITVDAGTTVVWEWTGNGGGHNVSAEEDSDFEFESERTDEEGFTFEQTFEESGAALYVCVPHRAQGMYGAVAVE